MSENSLEDFAREAVGSEDEAGLFSEEEKEVVKKTAPKLSKIAYFREI